MTVESQQQQFAAQDHLPPPRALMRDPSTHSCNSSTLTEGLARLTTKKINNNNTSTNSTIPTARGPSGLPSLKDRSSRHPGEPEHEGSAVEDAALKESRKRKKKKKNLQDALPASSEKAVHLSLTRAALMAHASGLQVPPDSVLGRAMSMTQPLLTQRRPEEDLPRPATPASLLAPHGDAALPAAGVPLEAAFTQREATKSAKKACRSVGHHPPHAEDEWWWKEAVHPNREKLREFWLQLPDAKRRQLVVIEKDLLLQRLKKHQKHSCLCEFCGGPKSFADDELEELYDAYYGELEQFAQARFHADQALMAACKASPVSASLPSNKTSSTPMFAQRVPLSFQPVALPDTVSDPDDDGSHIYERPIPATCMTSEESSCVSSFMDGKDMHKDPKLSPTADQERLAAENKDGLAAHHLRYRDAIANHLENKDLLSGNFFMLDKSLAPLGGGLLTLADDLLQNNGQKFLEMMERLALHSGLNDHSSDQGMGGDQDEDDEVLLHDEDSSDDYDEGDEDRDSDDSEMFYTSEDDDESISSMERREEGRRMFQVLAAKLFEERVMQAYQEKVAAENQERLLKELMEEEQQAKEQEERKRQKKQEKKERKRMEKEEKERKEQERLQAKEEEVRREEEKKAKEVAKQLEQTQSQRKLDSKQQAIPFEEKEPVSKVQSSDQNAPAAVEPLKRERKKSTKPKPLAAGAVQTVQAMQEKVIVNCTKENDLPKSKGQISKPAKGSKNEKASTTVPSKPPKETKRSTVAATLPAAPLPAAAGQTIKPKTTAGHRKQQVQAMPKPVPIADLIHLLRSNQQASPGSVEKALASTRNAVQPVAPMVTAPTPDASLSEKVQVPAAEKSSVPARVPAVSKPPVNGPPPGFTMAAKAPAKSESSPRTIAAVPSAMMETRKASVLDSKISSMMDTRKSFEAVPIPVHSSSPPLLPPGGTGDHHWTSATSTTQNPLELGAGQFNLGLDTLNSLRQQPQMLHADADPIVHMPYKQTTHTTRLAPIGSKCATQTMNSPSSSSFFGHSSPAMFSSQAGGIAMPPPSPFASNGMIRSGSLSSSQLHPIGTFPSSTWRHSNEMLAVPAPPPGLAASPMAFHPKPATPTPPPPPASNSNTPFLPYTRF